MCLESVTEADLPPPDLAAEMERILEQEPQLSDFGFGLADFYKTREEAAAKFCEDRERIRDPHCLAEFTAARGWLRQFDKLKSFNKRGNSYSLKHIAEHDIGYVSNGVFIAAAIAEGFNVQRIGNSSNAWFNISSTAWGRS
jgi:hypothetical protein